MEAAIYESYEHALILRRALVAHGFCVNEFDYLRFLKEIFRLGPCLLARNFRGVRLGFLSGYEPKITNDASRRLVSLIAQSTGFGWQLSSLLVDQAGATSHSDANEARALGSFIHSLIRVADHVVDESDLGSGLFEHLSSSQLVDVLNGADPRDCGLCTWVTKEISVRLFLGLLCAFGESARTLVSRTGATDAWTRFCTIAKQLYADECDVGRELPSAKSLQQRKSRAQSRLAVARRSIEISWHAIALAGIESAITLQIAWRLGEVMRLTDDLMDVRDDQLNGRPNMLFIRHDVDHGPSASDDSAQRQILADARSLMNLLERPIAGASESELRATRHFATLFIAKGTNWPNPFDLNG
jgi:hypothetical protein